MPSWNSTAWAALPPSSPPPGWARFRRWRAQGRRRPPPRGPPRHRGVGVLARLPPGPYPAAPSGRPPGVAGSSPDGAPRPPSARTSDLRASRVEPSQSSLSQSRMPSVRDSAQVEPVRAHPSQQAASLHLGFPCVSAGARCADLTISADVRALTRSAGSLRLALSPAPPPPLPWPPPRGSPLPPTGWLVKHEDDACCFTLPPSPPPPPGLAASQPPAARGCNCARWALPQ